MDDKTLALLGDREAQERLTAAGVLLPCPFCKLGGAKNCWNNRAPILTETQLALLKIAQERGS